MTFSTTTHRSSKHRSRRGVAAVVALAVLAVGCGSDADSADDVEPVVTISESADETADEAAADDAASDGEASDTADVVLQENGPITVTGEALAVFDSTVPDDTIGTAAPVIEGESFDGTPITIGGPTDNPTMIVFLAHWCPHCNDEIPELVSLNDAGSIPEGLDVVGVSTAVDASATNYPPSQWLVDKDWPWPAMADDDALSAISAMGGSSFPFTVILDTDGNVLARRGGSATAEATLEFINTALG